MFLKPEILSILIVRDLSVYTGGKSVWVPIEKIARRLALSNMIVVDRALEEAHVKGLLRIRDGDSVLLTEAGRQFVKS